MDLWESKWVYLLEAYQVHIQLPDAYFNFFISLLWLKLLASEVDFILDRMNPILKGTAYLTMKWWCFMISILGTILCQSIDLIQKWDFLKPKVTTTLELSKVPYQTQFNFILVSFMCEGKLSVAHVLQLNRLEKTEKRKLYKTSWVNALWSLV